MKDPENVLGMDSDLKNKKRSLLLDLKKKEYFCANIRSDANVNFLFN